MVGVGQALDFAQKMPARTRDLCLLSPHPFQHAYSGTVPAGLEEVEDLDLDGNFIEGYEQRGD